MKEKKAIGFDILDNAGLDKIDRIGTDMNMLDEKTKKRILDMTRKRYNDAIEGGNTGIYNKDINESAEVVENVEVYNRSKIRKIMTGVVNTAAVVGLAAGSVFLVKNLGGDNKPVEPDLPAVSSTEPANQTQEEKARNQRIEEYIQHLYYSTGDQRSDEYFYNNLKIDYAYLDINNDSVSELLIRYDFIDSAADAKGMSINYFDGTNYVHFYDVWGTFKFDLNNRKLYELTKTYLNENVLDISTWENIEISDNTVFFTSQDKYRPIESDDAHYSHNEEPCTKEEYENAIAEYENCVGAELNFIPYTVRKKEAAVNGQSAEEAARNQFIEEYIDDLYNVYGKPDEDKFYDCLKIDYAYLDINNDSVDELLVRYDFLEAAADAAGIGLNYFDGTKYIPFEDICITSKFDLQKCRLYELFEGHQGEKSLGIRTWENVEFSDNTDFFALLNNYYSEFGDTYDDVSYFNNGEPCTKEEYENAMAEYENCDSAELNFIPYTVKKKETAVNSQPNENLLQDDVARNKRIEDFIKYVYVSHNKVLDKERFDETLKIEYAYLDINNDSVSELLIRYDFLDHYYFGLELNCFDGTEYIPFENVQYASKFDLQNRKLYELYDGFEYEGFENEFLMDVKTWENTELPCNTDFFTYQESYHYYMTDDKLFYTHNGEQCTEGELMTAKAEYENCDNAELNYIPYIPDESFFKANSENNTVNGQTAEETARNKRIEEYIEYLYYYCDGESDKDEFYNSIKIDYAYLDINNDSVSELFIRYHNLNAFTPYYEGTELNYFDGTKYIPVSEINTTFKFNLQNRKLYQLSESHEGGYSLCTRTWGNSEFSDNMDFFTIQDIYSSDIVAYEPIEYSYTHNDEQCTKEEYEKAMDEYESCVGAELNFISYN